jgi:ribosomal protein S18 acetylase RimI-like enzyme
MDPLITTTGIAITLRPATAADSEFCYELHKAAMGGYVAATWGWDEHRQQGFHARAFTPGRWQVVTADGADAGMLDVEYRLDEVYLSRIEILPRYCGVGIGTALISELLGEAFRRGHDLLLDVLIVNEAAQRLYRRLGFTETTRNDVKVTMRSGAVASLASPCQHP